MDLAWRRAAAALVLCAGLAASAAPPPSPCDLSRGACRFAWGPDAGVELSITPRPITLVTPLRVEARFSGVRPARPSLTLTSSTMDMGVTRVLLLPTGTPGVHAGDTSLPVCGSDLLEWEARLAAEAGLPAGARFRFTTRPGPSPGRPVAAAPPPPALEARPGLPGVTLQSAGGPVTLSSLKGKVVLLYFGYTFCPDVCPTSLASLARALGSLSPAELARVQPVFISVDPDRDSPAHLAEYARYFHPSLLGLTGSPEVLAAAARPYGVVYALHPVPGAARYVVDHSAFTYLVGADGRLEARLPHGTPAPRIAEAIRGSLARTLPHPERP